MSGKLLGENREVSQADEEEGRLPEDHRALGGLLFSCYPLPPPETLGQKVIQAGYPTEKGVRSFDPTP